MPKQFPAVPISSKELKRVIFDQAIRATVSQMYVDLYDVGGTIEQTYATQADLAGIYGVFYDTADQVQVSTNTATPLVWSTTALATGVSATNNKIYFSQAGTYHIDFSAQVYSDSSSAKKVWFWPRINGIDVPGSTMLFTVSSNNHSNTVARSSVFQFQAGDYLEAMWAVDNVDAWLEAEAATAFAPGAPSAVLSVCRISS